MALAVDVSCPPDAACCELSLQFYLLRPIVALRSS